MDSTKKIFYILFILFSSFACNEIENNRNNVKSDNSHIENLIRKNEFRLLFLSFWMNMSRQEYNLIYNHLKKSNKKDTYNKIVFNNDIEAYISPEFHKDKLIALTISLPVTEYKCTSTRYRDNSSPDKVDCVSSSDVYFLLERYKEKYGKSRKIKTLKSEPFVNSIIEFKGNNKVIRIKQGKYDVLEAKEPFHPVTGLSYHTQKKVRTKIVGNFYASFSITYSNEQYFLIQERVHKNRLEKEKLDNIERHKKMLEEI